MIEDDCNGNVRAIERRALLLKCARALAASAVLLACAFAAWRGYSHLRARQLSVRTAQFIARGDLPRAVLTGRHLLAFDPDNLIAARAIAALAEQENRPEALEWRRKIAHLEPHVPAHQIQLARCALRFSHPEMAEKILDSLPPAAQTGADFHQLRGALALTRQLPFEAEKHFAAALLADPSNPTLELRLHLLRLNSTQPETAARARQTLTALAHKPAVRQEALRALATEALTRGEHSAALEWARQLNDYPDATGADSLLLYQASQDTPAAAATLASVQTKAATTPERAAELIDWLNRHEMAQTALAWREQLPQKILEAAPVPLALAQSLSLSEDWPALRAWVAEKNWGASESLRLAVESHALQHLGPADAPSMQSQVAWRAALKEAQTQPQNLAVIAQLAEGWGYQDQAEEAWWLIANSNQNTRPALAALQRRYQQNQDTRGLWRVARRIMELNPDDLVAASNCASFGLFLSGDNTSRRLASKLHSEHPANLAITATYAYALQTEGRAAEGLRLLEQQNQSDLQTPAIAAYYVVLLVENGELDRARTFLAPAQRARLLPEQKKLLLAATQKLLAVHTPELATK